jgi:hypothetical protein
MRDRAVAAVLEQRLRAGSLVCLLCERDLTGSGIEVGFFGEPARMMGGPAALAIDTGAALMPVTLWYDGPYLRAHIHPEIAVPGEGTRAEKEAVMTQELARVFEEAIARHPEDWHMLQKVFIADLNPKHPAPAAPRVLRLLLGKAVGPSGSVQGALAGGAAQSCDGYGDRVRYLSLPRKRDEVLGGC